MFLYHVYHIVMFIHMTIPMDRGGVGAQARCCEVQSVGAAYLQTGTRRVQAPAKGGDRQQESLLDSVLEVVRVARSAAASPGPKLRGPAWTGSSQCHPGHCCFILKSAADNGRSEHACLMRCVSGSCQSFSYSGPHSVAGWAFKCRTACASPLPHPLGSRLQHSWARAGNG